MRMNSASRRSHLQARILLRLEQGAARTVTELALAVGAQRPSVSRSLKTLRNEELVAHRRNGWTLTLAGEEEAKRCKQELAHVADSLSRTIKGFTTVELIKATSPTFGPLRGEALAETMGGTSFARLAESHRALSGVIAQSFAPLAESHRALSGVIAQSIGVPNLGLVISRNNAMVARTIEDIQAVCSAPSIRVHGFDRVLYPGVLRDIQDIGASYRALLSETAKIAVADLSERQHSWSRMLVPSSTVANFTHALRSEVALEPETDSVTLSRISDRADPQETLEQLLTDLNPDLVDKWQGSWQALKESNPDRLSQAAFSYRELIRMALDELAPDVEVDYSKQESKRKLQVRQILDGREGDFAEAMVEGIPKLYDLFSKSAHTSYRNKIAVQAALVAGDGLLLILLSSREAYQS